jgi:arginase family enzyme
MPEDVRDLLDNVASNPEDLEFLREDPARLGEKHDLDPDQIEALRSADQLIVSRERNPLVAGADRTITLGTTTYTADAGQPTQLEDLDHDRLLEVTRRMIDDPEYAGRVRDFVDL